MTNTVVFATAFLITFVGGALCLLRPHFVQALVLRFFSKHPILSALTFFKGFYATPYYIVVLRIIGLSALIISVVCAHSLIVLLR
jgi:hypothetical protein